jgi:hypothetical protein
MDRRTFLKTVPAFAALSGAASAPAAEPPAPVPGPSSAPPPAPAGLAPIALPKPETDGGKSVLAALKERRTNRNIRGDKLPPQMLSNLLWAAWGVNREAGAPGRPGRTAASASNSQEIDLYVALEEGTYLYDTVPHRLVPVAAGDLRGKVGRRRGGTPAPVQLIFVADIARYAGAPFQEPGLRDPEIQKSYSNIAVGLIAGNVYLFAASQGLAAWFHNCDKAALAEALKLRPEQRVLYAQTVGYPA